MQGLCYLHTLPSLVVHGDVKLANALLDTGMVVRVSSYMSHVT